MLIACSTGNSQLPLGQKTQKGGWVGSVSSRECLDAPAIPATLKVARIAGASRHSRLETEPRTKGDCRKPTKAIELSPQVTQFF